MLNALLHRFSPSRWLTARSIKEGFDDLPTAACYFTAEGTIKLCNLQMFRVYRALSGRDLQTLDELHAQIKQPAYGQKVGLENPVFLLPDGRCWFYTETPVTTEDGTPYTEAVFSEVTELYEKRQELLAQTEELRQMSRQLKELSDHVQEMTREKEILTFKTRLHDQMGYGLAAVRQCLVQEKTPDEGDTALHQLEKAVQLFQKDSSALTEETEWAEFVQDAAALGVSVHLTGTLPADTARQQLLLTVARECFTNAVRHADATALNLIISETEKETVWSFTNNGTPPAGPITPGGGLTALQRRVRAEGGKLLISTTPCYQLRIELPKEESV